MKVTSAILANIAPLKVLYAVKLLLCASALILLSSLVLLIQPAGAAPPNLVLDPGHFNLDLDGKVTKDGAHAVVNGREVWEGELTLAVSEYLRAELEARSGERGNSGKQTVFATRWLDPALPQDDPKNHKFWLIKSHGYDQELANIGRAEFANEKILGKDWREVAIGSADSDGGSTAATGLFIRIHFDGSANKSDSGFAVYYNDQSDYDKDGVIARESKVWAERVAMALANGTKSADGTVRHKQWLIPPNGANNGVKRFTRPIYGFKYAKVPSILIECGFLTNAGDLAVIMKPENQKLLAELIADAVVVER
jgi:N-acetylmuramoyl-L-alanine amidase